MTTQNDAMRIQRGFLSHTKSTHLQHIATHFRWQTTLLYFIFTLITIAMENVSKLMV